MADEKSIAALTIKGAGDMTPEGRRAVADWLCRQAADLIADGHQYAARFRARYMVWDDE